MEEAYALPEATEEAEAVGERLGTVRIAPQVLATIARLATLEVDGVVSMHHDFGDNMDRIFKGLAGGEGVTVDIIDGAVTVNLSVVGAPGVNLYKVGRKVQNRVARAITDMVRMPVLAVNVHFAAIELPTES
ncbi:MAG: Asp23/Gls24 family envelope stress response protein [Anaerolineae bacterium]